MKQYIVEGFYDLIESRKAYAIPGSFPRRYWDIIEAEDEDDLAAYLAGQQSFENGPQDQYEKSTEFQRIELSVIQSEHTCARCQKPCKEQYTHCFRCNQYLKVKASIA